MRKTRRESRRCEGTGRQSDRAAENALGRADIGVGSCWQGGKKKEREIGLGRTIHFEEH